MMSAHTTQRSSLGFRFFIIPFLLITTLALDAPIAHAESSFGSALSGKKSLLVPSVITILTRGVPATPRQAQSGSVAAVGGFQNCDLITTVDQHQSYNLGDSWHSLRPSGDQPTMQATNRRKDAQSTISHQNPSLSKAVL